ncbi:MAG: acyclic terpene utilization AtuA family protein [Pseudomonadota bacterium]
MSRASVRIGGACGFWGESAVAVPQFLRAKAVDYIVFDYLAEITMSIMARAKAKNPEYGYATDFVTAVIKPHIKQIAAQGVRLVANAGGVNAEACGRAVRAVIAEAGLDLKVAVITGDDLLDRADEIAAQAPPEMFTGAAFPDTASLASINAYLGAFPIAHALEKGADIVITGRCVDSAVTLGICVHTFGWAEDTFDLLASGSLAGHILECGPQATGGNFTDWRLAGDISKIGYPIASVFDDGRFEVTKPEDTSGLVTPATVCEQLVYEIGDPQAYLLPDVSCDFASVSVEQVGPNRVTVSPAKGRAPSNDYKICATYRDGFRTGTSAVFYGVEADQKAQAFADATLLRARDTLRGLNAPDFSEVNVEILGAGSQFGVSPGDAGVDEVVLKIAAKHETPLEGQVLLKELTGLGLSTPPGLSGFRGAVPKPSPIVRLFSFLMPKDSVPLFCQLSGDVEALGTARRFEDGGQSVLRAAPPEPIDTAMAGRELPLIKLAWGRSGDKGDKANIGIIARDRELVPWIWGALTESVLAGHFAHFIEGGADASKVERFHLPGIGAMNILIDRVLGGGGVASIRSDAQAKGYAQILLSKPIPLPSDLAEKYA